MRNVYFILNRWLEVNEPSLVDIKQWNYVEVFRGSFEKFEQLLNHKNEDFFCKTFTTPYFDDISKFRIFFWKMDKPDIIFR